MRDPESLSALKIDYYNHEHCHVNNLEKESDNLIEENLLWEGLKNGDKDSLGRLYSQYIDLLFSYGMSHSQDRSYIKDCIHDLFVDLYKYRKNLSNTDNIKYYLLKSLTRKINKKYKLRTVYFSEESEFIDVKNPQNHLKSQEDNIIDREHLSERDKKLENALSTLTDKQKEGLQLRYNEEKTYEEISQIMGVSIQTARTTTYRAIKALRKLKLGNFLKS